MAEQQRLLAYAIEQAEVGNYDLIECVLDGRLKIDPTVKLPYVCPALIEAIQHGNVRVVQTIYNAGINIDNLIEDSVLNPVGMGETALSIAASAGQIAICDLLIDHKCDRRYTQRILEELIRQFNDAKPVDDIVIWCLEHKFAIKELVYGADANKLFKYFYELACQRAVNGNAELLRGLHTIGLFGDYDVGDGQHCLTYIIRNFPSLAPRLLHELYALKVKVNVNEPDGNGEFPLMLAVESGNEELVQTLLDAGAAINPAIMEDLENLQAELSDEERAAAARMEKLLGPALEQYRRNEQEGLFDAL